MACRQHGLPAQGSPGRGKVPSRPLSPKPKSMASWQHGVPGGTAATSEAPWSKGAQGEEGFRRDSCLRNPSPWPAGSMGCRWERRSPLEQGSAGRGRVPSRLMSPKPKSMACWQHGLPVGTATTVVVWFSDALRNSRCVGADVHTPDRGIYARRGKPSLPSWRGLRTHYESQGV